MKNSKNIKQRKIDIVTIYKDFKENERMRKVIRNLKEDNIYHNRVHEEKKGLIINRPKIKFSKEIYMVNGRKIVIHDRTFTQKKPFNITKKCSKIDFRTIETKLIWDIPTGTFKSVIKTNAKKDKIKFQGIFALDFFRQAYTKDLEKIAPFIKNTEIKNHLENVIKLQNEGYSFYHKTVEEALTDLTLSIMKHSNVDYGIRNDVKNNIDEFYETKYLLYNILKYMRKKFSQIKDLDKFCMKTAKNMGKKIKKTLFENPFMVFYLKRLIKIFDGNIDKIQPLFNVNRFITIERFEYLYNDLHWDKNIILTKEYGIKLTANKITDMLSSNVGNRIMDMSDIAHMLESIPEKFKNEVLSKTSKCKNIEEIHDTIAEIERNISDEEKVINRDYENDYNYDILTKEGFIVEFPHNKKELNRWGERFHNCVASYFERINDGTCNIFTIWNNGNPVACVEIRKNKIRQAFGPCNKNLEGDFKEIFDKWTVANKLANETVCPM